MSVQQQSSREQAMRRNSIVSGIVNASLAAIKVVVGVLGHSAALVADGVHSLSDLATDLMVWFASGVSNQPPDKEHPYGHGRIETAFTVVLGAVLMLTALGILIDAGQRVLDVSRMPEPALLVLIIAAVSILAKEALYRYTLREAKRQNSNLLRANAWHHRSDAISSVVVLIGAAGSRLGFPYLDPFAAAGVALMIAHVGWDLARKATLELVDTGLEPERLRTIRALISEVEGVHDLLLLRTRSLGGRVALDAHVKVSPQLSVSEGHQIGMYVRDHLLASRQDIVDVTIHIDLEDAEQEARSRDLPLRHEVIARLREYWKSNLPETAWSQLVLHYFDGRIGVDVLLDWDSHADTDPAVLAAKLQQAASSLPWLGQVRVRIG